MQQQIVIFDNMPIYTLKCSHCSKTEEIFRSIKNMDNEIPECCNNKMERIIVSPLVMNDISPYISQVTGELISSRGQHKEHLKQHGCIEIGNEVKHLKPFKVKEPEGMRETISKIVYSYNT